MNISVVHWHRGLPALLAALAISACAVQPPRRAPSPPPPSPGPSTPSEPPAETRPVPLPEPPGELPGPIPVPVPVPAIPEPVLSAASRALVGQAQAQSSSRNYVMAASSLERALRIEPGNPLLWIELGKVRQAEGNYVQAENMGRKAVSLSKAPQASAAAWRLIADSLRARGKAGEASEAELKADSSR